jgi:hypothetical protein
MIIQSRTGDYAAVVDFDTRDSTVTVVLYMVSPRQHLGTWRFDEVPFHVVCDRVYQLINEAPDPTRHMWVPELGRVVDKLK